MFEYPELKTIVKQMKSEIIGKTIESIEEVKNIYSNVDYSPCNNGIVSEIECLAPGAYIKLDNGYGILIKDAGGKLIYNKMASGILKNYGVIIKFTDGSNITYNVGLGACWLLAISHDDWQTQKVNNQKFDPLANNTFVDYLDFIKKRTIEEINKPIKIFLSTNIFGVRSSFAAEILLYAKIHPTVQLHKLSDEQHKRVYESMKSVLTTACDKSGRENEYNLYAQKGNYIAMSGRKHIGENCPVCKNILEKSTIGGVTAFCPNCQTK